MLTSLTKVGKDIMKALLQTKEVDFRILRTVAKPDELVLPGFSWTMLDESDLVHGYSKQCTSVPRYFSCFR